VSESTGCYTVYRYVGPGWLNGVPARDLLPADLAELADREGIDEAAIVASGLYEVEDVVEVAPFCGAELSGILPDLQLQRCQEPVAQWGERCEGHRVSGCKPDLQEVSG